MGYGPWSWVGISHMKRSMETENSSVKGICNACIRVKVRRRTASAARNSRLKAKVYTPTLGGVMRLSTNGRLERGDVPRAARVMKAIPPADTATPAVNSP